MDKSKITKWLAFGAAILAGISAFSDEMENQKQKARINEMDKRIKALEANNEEEEQ